MQATIKIFSNFLVLISILGITSLAMGQGKSLASPDEVIAAANAELDALMQDEKFLEKLQKENIVGDYTYAISISDKSRISSMRILEKSEDATIPGQNFYNNLVKSHKFNFKVAKGKSFKMQYTFKSPK